MQFCLAVSLVLSNLLNLVSGLVLGNVVVLPLAVIFMFQLECIAIEAFLVRPHLYPRYYIDDCMISLLLLWQHGVSSLMSSDNFPISGGKN